MGNFGLVFFVLFHLCSCEKRVNYFELQQNVPSLNFNYAIEKTMSVKGGSVLSCLLECNLNDNCQSFAVFNGSLCYMYDYYKNEVKEEENIPAFQTVVYLKTDTSKTVSYGNYSKRIDKRGDLVSFLSNSTFVTSYDTLVEGSIFGVFDHIRFANNTQRYYLITEFGLTTYDENWAPLSNQTLDFIPTGGFNIVQDSLYYLNPNATGVTLVKADSEFNTVKSVFFTGGGLVSMNYDATIYRIVVLSTDGNMYTFDRNLNQAGFFSLNASLLHGAPCVASHDEVVYFSSNGDIYSILNKTVIHKVASDVCYLENIVSLNIHASGYFIISCSNYVVRIYSLNGVDSSIVFEDVTFGNVDYKGRFILVRLFPELFAYF